MSNPDTTSSANLSTDLQIQQTIIQLQQQLASLTVDQASQVPELLSNVEAFQKIEQQLAGTFEKRMAYSKINGELQRLADRRTIETKQIALLEEALPGIKKRAEAEFFDKAILPSLQQLTALLNEYEPQFSSNEVLQKHVEGIRLIEKSFVKSLEALGFTDPVAEEVTDNQDQTQVSEATTNEQVTDTTQDQDAQDLSQSEANNKE